MWHCLRGWFAGASIHSARKAARKANSRLGVCFSAERRNIQSEKGGVTKSAYWQNKLRLPTWLMPTIVAYYLALLEIARTEF
jgi:hypothetical protein